MLADLVLPFDQLRSCTDLSGCQPSEIAAAIQAVAEFELLAPCERSTDRRICFSCSGPSLRLEEVSSFFVLQSVESLGGLCLNCFRSRFPTVSKIDTLPPKLIPKTFAVNQASDVLGEFRLYSNIPVAVEMALPHFDKVLFVHTSVQRGTSTMNPTSTVLWPTAFHIVAAAKIPHPLLQERIRCSHLVEIPALLKRWEALCRSDWTSIICSDIVTTVSRLRNEQHPVLLYIISRLIADDYKRIYVRTPKSLASAIGLTQHEINTAIQISLPRYLESSRHSNKHRD